VARVRIRCRASQAIILREGNRLGRGQRKSARRIHERAIKAAETDATKRALATFGNRFGLCLYDKGQAGCPGPILQTAFSISDPVAR